MTAIYRIKQGANVGAWGIAKKDIQLFSVGGSVSVEAQTSGLIYLWELISEPAGSNVTVSNNTSQIASLDLTVTGGYLLRLTVEAGTAQEDVSELYLGVPLAVSRLPIPAFNETIHDNSEPAGGVSVYGYERKLTAFLKWVDNAFTEASIIVEGGAAQTSIRKEAGNATASVGSVIIGVDNTIVNAYNPYTTIFGHNNEVTGGTESSIGGNFLAGLDLSTAFTDSTTVLGQHNSVSHSIGSMVSGRYLTVNYGNYVRVLGSSCLSEHDLNVLLASSATTSVFNMGCIFSGNGGNYFFNNDTVQVASSASTVGLTKYSSIVGSNIKLNNVRDSVVVGEHISVRTASTGNTIVGSNISLGISGGGYYTTRVAKVGTTVTLTYHTDIFEPHMFRDNTRILVEGTEGPNDGLFSDVVYVDEYHITYTNANGVDMNFPAKGRWSLDGTVGDLDYTTLAGRNYVLQNAKTSIVQADNLSVPDVYYGSVFNSLVLGQEHVIRNLYASVILGRKNVIGPRSGGLHSVAISVSGYDNRVGADSSGLHLHGFKNSIGLFNRGTDIKFSVSGSTVTLEDPDGNFTAETCNNQFIDISGAKSHNNNGMRMMTYVDATHVTYTNAQGVTEDGLESTGWRIKYPPAHDGGYSNIIGMMNTAYKLVYSNIIGMFNNVYNASFSSVIGSSNAVTGHNSMAVSVFGTGNTLQADMQHVCVVGSSCRTTVNTSVNYVRLYGSGAVSHGHNVMSIYGTGKIADGSDFGEGQLLDHIPYSGETTNETPKSLSLLGRVTTSTWQLRTDQAYVLHAQVVSKAVTGYAVGEVKGWNIDFVVNHNGTAPVLVGTPVKTVLAQTSTVSNAWDVVPYFAAGNLYMRVTGVRDVTIRWQCFLAGPEVGGTHS